MKIAILSLSTLTLAISGCCGKCSQFQENLFNGLYYEAAPYTRIQKIVDKSLPKSFTAVARVVLKDNSTETAFTVKLRVDADKNELRMAAVTDFGNVIFSALATNTLKKNDSPLAGKKVTEETLDENTHTKLLKNNSRWSDETIVEILSTYRSLSMSQLSRNCIVQLTPGKRWLYRCMDTAKTMTEIELDEAGERVAEIRRRHFSFWGEFERVNVTRILEYGSSHGVRYPKRIEISDDSDDVKVQINVRRWTIVDSR